MLQISTSQLRTIRKLVKDECANYIANKCIILNGDCSQLSARRELCSYFKKSVLPLNEYLYAEITRNGHTKKCETCNGIFISNARNTRFCPECAKNQVKKSKRKYINSVRSSIG